MKAFPVFFSEPDGVLVAFEKNAHKAGYEGGYIGSRPAFTKTRRIWEVSYKDISMTDKNNLFALFDIVGTAIPFMWRDPGGKNLMIGSEDFSIEYFLKAGWALYGSSLRVTAAEQDPFGTYKACKIENLTKSTDLIWTYSRAYGSSSGMGGGFRYSPSFYIKKINSADTGVVRVSHPDNHNAGLWEIDLSQIADTNWHRCADPAEDAWLTEVKFWRAMDTQYGYSGETGMFIYEKSGSDSLDFYFAFPQIEAGTKVSEYVNSSYVVMFKDEISVSMGRDGRRDSATWDVTFTLEEQ